MDEVRLWNVARTAEQINSNKGQSLTGFEPGLVAYYRFDESSGTTAIDATSNGHDGLLINSSDAHVTSDVSLSAAATLASISVAPASPSLKRGETEQFTATGHFADNSTKTLTSQVQWSSSETAVATIDTSGLATGVSDGTSSITATLDGVSSAATDLTVMPAVTLDSISVTPTSPSLSLNLTKQFTAKGHYSDGTTRVITSEVSWQSSATSVATIDVTGLATGVSLGTSTITATLDDVTVTTSLTVAATATNTNRDVAPLTVLTMVSS